MDAQNRQDSAYPVIPEELSETMPEMVLLMMEPWVISELSLDSLLLLSSRMLQQEHPVLLPSS